jgi:hypothetical protein
MLRTCSRGITLAVMLVGLSTAQAADTTLTLACQGTTLTTTKDEPEPISMGIIINFTKGTGHGFADNIFPVNVTGVTEVNVVFFGAKPTAPNSATDWHIRGTLDRVTGDVEATSIVFDVKTGSIKIQTSYSLKCRPTQRMF